MDDSLHLIIIFIGINKVGDRGLLYQAIMQKIFEYDNQTFHDLEILKELHETSVFTIFNKTLTEGGSDYLMKLFQNPISDLEELESRGRFIQFLIDNPLKLVISSRQIKFIERYINLNTLILKSNPIDSLYLRFTEWLRPSNEYYLLKAGCESLVQVLHELNQKLHQDSTSSELEPFTITQQGLIHELKSELLLNPTLSWHKVIKLDQLFRGKYNRDLKALLQEIYILDAYISIAKTASEEAFTLPKYEKSSKPIFFARGLKIHSLINYLQKGFQSGIYKGSAYGF